MSDPAHVDPAMIREALGLVGEELRSLGALGEIMVHGGAVFLLRYRWSDDGRSIVSNVSLDGRNGPVRDAAERSARRVGLPEGWWQDLLPALYDVGNARSGGFPTGMYPSWERPGLRVLAAQPCLVVPMVFLASLDPSGSLDWDDLEPAVGVAARAGVKTSERLRELVRPYLGEDANPNRELSREVERRLSAFDAAIERFGHGVVLEAEPRSLADVAALGRRDRDSFWHAMHAFVARFYVEKDGAAKQGMLDPATSPTGEAKFDPWIGATGEHLAQRWGLHVPAWTQEPAFMGGSAPRFFPCNPIARGIQIAETPPAFRRRLLFTYAEPLMNAKFPHDRKVRMPFWT